MSEDKRDPRKVGEAFEEVKEDLGDFLETLGGDKPDDPETARPPADAQDDEGDTTIININK